MFAFREIDMELLKYFIFNIPINAINILHLRGGFADFLIKKAIDVVDLCWVHLTAKDMNLFNYSNVRKIYFYECIFNESNIKKVNLKNWKSLTSIGINFDTKYGYEFNNFIFETVLLQTPNLNELVIFDLFQSFDEAVKPNKNTKKYQKNDYV